MKLSIVQLRAEAKRVADIAREVCMSGDITIVAPITVDGQHYPARYEIHPVDIAVDYVDWDKVKRGQQNELMGLIRAHVAEWPAPVWIPPVPALTPMRLTGPRGVFRNGETVARSYFNRIGDRMCWQWVAFDHAGQVIDVKESSWEFGRHINPESALWELREFAAWAFSK